MKKTQTQVLVLLIIGIFLILISPFIFTRSLGLIDFSKTGEIGDTIGGITAPISGLIGSVLVYYALKAQIDANKLIQEQLSNQKKADSERKVVDFLTTQLAIVRDEINEFAYREIITKSGNGGQTKTEETIKGSDAVFRFLQLYLLVKYRDGNNPFSEIYQITKLKNLLNLIENYLSTVIREDLSHEDKKYLISIMKYIYDTKIKPHFDYQETSPESSLKYRKEQGVDELFVINNSIKSILDNHQ